MPTIKAEVHHPEHVKSDRDARMVGRHPWMTLLFIKYLRDEGADPEAFAKRQERSGKRPDTVAERRAREKFMRENPELIPPSPPRPKLTPESVRKINAAPFKRRKWCVDHFND